ncbi:MAG: hypothetical protein K8H88_18255 [Sandaracinaceae bacterium]|nr:hypothetical protein [Sandaracinaceae bacterium]
MQRYVIASLLVLQTACGGAPAAAPETSETTSGGEEPPAPLVRTTTPVPVPQPAVAREAMSEALQALWTHIEETIELRPPDGPTAGTQDAVREWAQGPFATWLTARRERLQQATQMSEAIPEDPAYERAVAGGLFGYAIEEMAADVRGAPIPDDIANDAELLQIYTESLDEALRPLATESVQAYAFCASRLRALGDESEWLPWRAYCVQRGREMVDVYRLYEQAEPPSEQAAEPAPPD